MMAHNKLLGHRSFVVSAAALILTFSYAIAGYSSQKGRILTPEQLHLLLSASENNGSLPVIRELLRASRKQLTKASTWLQFNDTHGDNPLIRAARRDNFGAVKLLLPVLKDLLPVQNKANQTAIHEAVANNATHVIEYIFKSPSDAPYLIEIQEGTYSRTPLYLAAELGNLFLVKFFANLGADMFARSNYAYGGAMPIHEAARWDHREIVAFLHSRGCNVGLEESWWGRTPLHEAAINGSLEMVKMLVERGSNVFARSYPRDQMYTAMHWAVTMGHMNVVKYLLDYEPQLIDAVDRDGDKPIHSAALNNRIELVELFLSLGMDVMDRQASFSRTLLHQAAHKGHLALLHRLLQLGADPYAVSNQLDCWQLPVHLAASSGQLATFKALIELYPDQLTKRDGCKRSVVDLAELSTRQEDAIELLQWLHIRLANEVTL